MPIKLIKAIPAAPPPDGICNADFYGFKRLCQKEKTRDIANNRYN